MELWIDIFMLFSPSIRCLRPPPLCKGSSSYGNYISKRGCRVSQTRSLPLYHDSVAKGRFLYGRLTRSLVLPVVLIPAPASQLTSWYDIKRGTRRLRADKTFGETLTTEWNVNMEDVEFVTVSSIQGHDAAYINWFNVREKCLLTCSNFQLSLLLDYGQD
jgi:hypothetical protein